MRKIIVFFIIIGNLTIAKAQRTEVPGGKIRLEAIVNDSTKILAESLQATMVVDRSINQLTFNVPLETFFEENQTNDSLFFYGYKGQILTFKGIIPYDSFKLFAISNEPVLQKCRGQLTLNDVSHDYLLQFTPYKLSNNMDGNNVKISFTVVITTADYSLNKPEFPKIKTLEFCVQEGMLNLIN